MEFNFTQQIDIVELDIEALLEAGDIYTTRRTFFSARGVGGRERWEVKNFKQS